jgi:hypothetical protein
MFVYCVETKPGGLGSQDPLRLRSRLLDLTRSTFETSQNFVDGRDRFFSLKKSRFCLNTTIQIQISQSRSSYNFHKS